jgi:hypothetical protein
VEFTPSRKKTHKKHRAMQKTISGLVYSSSIRRWHNMMLCATSKDAEKEKRNGPKPNLQPKLPTTTT